MTGNEALRKVMAARGELDAEEKNLASLSDTLDELKQKLSATEEFRAIVLKVASDTQHQLVLRFETIVQSALDAIFPNEYKFKMEFVQRRGRTEVDIWLDKNGTRMDPLDSNGGGVVDVLSIALRICCLTLSTKARVLILDEPFKHLRGVARDKLGTLLSMLSEKLGLQIIMVADVAGSITTGRVFTVSKEGAVSKIRGVEINLKDECND